MMFAINREKIYCRRIELDVVVCETWMVCVRMYVCVGG